MTRKYFLFIAYFLFLLILFEGVARIAFQPRFLKYLSSDDNLSWRRSWIERRKQRGFDGQYKFDIYNEQKGWISKPNLRNMTVFDGKKLNTNAAGFRGIKDYSPIKRPGVVRILVLGDSFTFGDEVTDNETYSYYLQKMFSNVEVMNFGVHGYGHDQMLILLKEVGARLKPDIILLGFVAMDMQRNLLSFRDYAKPRFIIANDELKQVNTPVPRPMDTMKLDSIRPRIVDLISLVLYHIKEVTNLNRIEREHITTAILTEMIEFAHNIQAIPIFAYLPCGKELSSPNLLITHGERYFSSMCTSNRTVKCLYTRPNFVAKARRGTKFKLHGHWGALGHFTVAESIRDFLIKERILDFQTRLVRPLYMENIK